MVNIMDYKSRIEGHLAYFLNVKYSKFFIALLVFEIIILEAMIFVTNNYYQRGLTNYDSIVIVPNDLDYCNVTLFEDYKNFDYLDFITCADNDDILLIVANNYDITDALDEIVKVNADAHIAQREELGSIFNGTFWIKIFFGFFILIFVLLIMLSIKMLRKLVITNKKDLSLLKLNGFTDFDIVQLTIRNSYIYKVGFFVSVLLVNYIALIILEFSIEQIVFWLIVIALLFIAVILEQVLILYLCVKRVKPEYFIDGD